LLSRSSYEQFLDFDIMIRYFVESGVLLDLLFIEPQPTQA
jgi:hypothetical protein